MDSISKVSEMYVDSPDIHVKIWTEFKRLVNQDDELREHRNWIVQNQWGYGNRAFHWLWNILVQELPQGFKMLEIGVFKGATISAWSLLNRRYNKNGQIYGVTPLSKTGDKYATHPDVDYEECIQTIYATWGLDASDLNIIHGLSNDVTVVQTVASEGPYDVVYVDGCHDLPVVLSDIDHYGKLLKPLGYMIMDDASCNLNIPDGLIRMNWKGLPDVSEAVAISLEKNSSFKELFAVGHIRVFQKL